MKSALAGVVVLLIAALLWLGGQPHVSTEPLAIKHNGVHAPYNVRNSQGDLLFYNFRAVEPEQLYRSSGFVLNRRVKVYGEVQRRAAAFADDQAFEFFRARNIRTIFDLQDAQTHRAEQEYFAEWSKKTGYRIKVKRLTVLPTRAYDSDSALLSSSASADERRSGLRAAAEFLRWMKTHKPEDGAVYIHDDAGKDRVGVVCAAYELWRNRGTSDPDTLWQQVLDRYLVSNVVIARDAQAARIADKTSCDGGEDFVCAQSLEKLREQLEFIAQL